MAADSDPSCLIHKGTGWHGAKKPVERQADRTQTLSADKSKRTWIWVATAIITAERQLLLIELILIEVRAAGRKGGVALWGAAGCRGR